MFSIVQYPHPVLRRDSISAAFSIPDRSPSQVFGWLTAAFVYVAVKSGAGRHFDTLTLEQKSSCILWTIVGFAPGIMSFAVPKLATVALLTNILLPDRPHKVFLWAMSSTCVAILIGCVVALVVRCHPARSLWDLSITEKSCGDQWAMINYGIFAGSKYLLRRGTWRERRLD